MIKNGVYILNGEMKGYPCGHPFFMPSFSLLYGLFVATLEILKNSTAISRPLGDPSTILR